jgi:hypothetical protein
MSEFLQGFIKGAQETPRGFFAPLIAVWGLLVNSTDSTLRRRTGKKTIS